MSVNTFSYTASNFCASSASEAPPPPTHLPSLTQPPDWWGQESSHYNGHGGAVVTVVIATVSYFNELLYSPGTVLGILVLQCAVDHPVPELVESVRETFYPSF